MNASSEQSAPLATGGCLCGEVRFEVHDHLMDVINCHCSKCRRFHGHVGAYTATDRENLILTQSDTLNLSEFQNNCIENLVQWRACKKL